MQLITIQAVPSQEVIVTLEGNRYKIQIKDADGFMTYGVIRNGETLLENGTRIVNGSPLLPYKYMESGNFALSVPDSELPNYEQFGLTQFLYYATQEELESIR